MSVLSFLGPKLTPIIPQVGGRGTQTSIAFRNFGGKGRWLLVATLSKQVAHEVGFRDNGDPCWAEIGFDEVAGVLHIANVNGILDEVPEGIRWKGNKRQGTLVFALPARWMPDYTTKHGAENCRFRLRDYPHNTSGKTITVPVIEITVPDWAAPMRRSTAAAREAADTARARSGLAAMPHVRPGPR